MTRYCPARHYLPAAIVAFALAIFSGWCGWNWKLALIPAFLFLASSALLLALAMRPPITIRDGSWTVGDDSFLWSEVERLDTTGWTSPLILRIALRSGRLLHVVYPGDTETSAKLLRQMRHLARGARIDGIPYEQYWGERPAVASPEEHPTPPRYHILRPEDEEEVERLYSRLKSVGRLEGSPEERHGHDRS